MNAKITIENVKLETNRCILRPFKEEDLDDFYAYASVDGVGQMAGWCPHQTKEESKKILNLFIKEKKTLAIVLKENNQVIGSIGIENYNEEAFLEYKDVLGRELGYVLAKDYWGRGLMPEAVKKVIEYCFSTFHLSFLLCAHFKWNHQSQRVIEKCGFQFIKERTQQTANGTIENTCYYILNNEEVQK